jgi:hypothetical protein
MLELFLAAAAGLTLHVLSRYAEAWRAAPADARPSPLAFLRTDGPGWLAAAGGVAVVVWQLPALGPVLGLAVTPAGALMAGYMGSSLLRKLPAPKP